MTGEDNGRDAMRFSDPVAALSRINERLLRVAGLITITAMAIMAVVIPYEVAGRYLFAAMPVWSGEVATYSLVWLSMMGAAIGMRKGYQMSLTAVVEKLPEPGARLARDCALGITIILFVILTWYGLAQTIVNAKQVSPALGISMALPYASLPAGFALMALITLEKLLRREA